jgi:hypothetical protein
MQCYFHDPYVHNTITPDLVREGEILLGHLVKAMRILVRANAKDPYGACNCH